MPFFPTTQSCPAGFSVDRRLTAASISKVKSVRICEGLRKTTIPSVGIGLKTKGFEKSISCVTSVRFSMQHNSYMVLSAAPETPSLKTVSTSCPAASNSSVKRTSTHSSSLKRMTFLKQPRPRNDLVPTRLHKPSLPKYQLFSGLGKRT